MHVTVALPPADETSCLLVASSLYTRTDDSSLEASTPGLNLPYSEYQKPLDPENRAEVTPLSPGWIGKLAIIITVFLICSIIKI